MLKSCRIRNTITGRFMKPWIWQKMIIIFNIHLFIFRQIAQLVYSNTYTYSLLLYSKQHINSRSRLLGDSKMTEKLLRCAVYYMESHALVLGLQRLAYTEIERFCERTNAAPLPVCVNYVCNPANCNRE